MARDKKRMGGDITLVLIRAIGECYLHKVSMAEARTFLQAGYEG